MDLETALGSAGVALLVTTLAVAHTGNSSPISQLGVRPMGNGLWSWLTNYLKSIAAVGCWGYDPILGCWSPVMRMLFHISGYLILWSLVIMYWSIGADECCPVPKKALGFWCVVLYGGFFHYNHHMKPNVSFPGGPRPHKIQRVPEWDDKTTQLTDVKGWRCAVAKDSHEATTVRFADNQHGRMTGEAAGRQIWTTVPRSPAEDNTKPKPTGGWFGTAKKKVDEKVVATMACGGRNAGFNASKNPNRYDVLHEAPAISISPVPIMPR